uniref:Uncharacterized protein n=1 Tax=Periophthalmus magnuspinnatus TaxID=409849 RepID=A0A3B4AED0_9GOBI
VMELTLVLLFGAVVSGARGLELRDLFPFGEEAGDATLTPGSDSSAELGLEPELRFFSEAFDKIHISSNGLVAVQQPPPQAEYLGQTPPPFGLMAALMGDLDRGLVHFRLDRNPEVLDRSKDLVQKAFPQRPAQTPEGAVVVTWDKMAAAGSDGAEVGWRNSFQLVLVLLRSSSVAVLLYPRSGLQFLSSPAGGAPRALEAGFSEGLVYNWWWGKTQGKQEWLSSEGEESVRRLTRGSNCGVGGVWVFEVGAVKFSQIEPGTITTFPEDITTSPPPVTMLPRRPDPRVSTATDEPMTPEKEEPENIYEDEYSNTMNTSSTTTSTTTSTTITPTTTADYTATNTTKYQTTTGGVFSYNPDTCAQKRGGCSPFAECRDHASGSCCYCRHGYYGNGKDCVAEGKPQRMSGQVSGRVFLGSSPVPVEFSQKDLHSYVVTNDGRAYVAISSVTPPLGPALLPLSSVGGVIGWAFALEQPGHRNGFSIMGGVFSRRAQVLFSTGEGIDEHEHLQVHTELEGALPPVPLGATVQVSPYSEVYHYYDNLITSSSNREYSVVAPSGEVQNVSYQWRQTITYQSCVHAPGTRPGTGPGTGPGTRPDIQQLTVDQIFVMYDQDNSLIRYAMSNRIGPVHSSAPESNPCFSGGHGCDINAVCRPLEGQSFTCVCSSGFSGDGNHCEDVDECLSPGLCGPNSFCSNTVGSYRCVCPPGSRLSPEGQCTGTRPSPDIDECERAPCHHEASCSNTQGSYRCECKPGFTGDGLRCENPGSVLRPASLCELDRARALSRSSGGLWSWFRPRSSVFVPRCDSGGHFETTQCSEEQCWCVDTEGAEVQGSRVSGTDSPPHCVGPVTPPPFGPAPSPGVGHVAPGRLLLFAQSGRIEQVPLSQTGPDQTRPLLHVPDRVVIAVAYDCVEDSVYWTEISGPSIGRASLRDTERGPRTLVSSDLQSPEGLALDPVSRLLFWTDSGLDLVEVSRLDGSQRRVLFNTDLENPRAIVTDPVYGRIFWSDWNRDGPKIEMSNMDGSDRVVLVQEDLGLPNGLTYDPQSTLLCWADAGTRRVECMDPHLRQRSTVSDHVQYPFGLVSVGRSLYYTDWRRDAVVGLDRFSRTETLVISPQRKSRVYGISTTDYCPRVYNYCEQNGGCSHLCLPKLGGFSCLCPDRRDGTCYEPGQNWV